MLLEDGQLLPMEVPSPNVPCQGADCASTPADGQGSPERPGEIKAPGSNKPQDLPGVPAGAPSSQLPAAAPLVPPPPLLPPPPLR